MEIKRWRHLKAFYFVVLGILEAGYAPAHGLQSNPQS